MNLPGGKGARCNHLSLLTLRSQYQGTTLPVKRVIDDVQDMWQPALTGRNGVTPPRWVTGLRKINTSEILL